MNGKRARQVQAAMAGALAALFAIAASSPAHAQSRAMHNLWVVQPVPVPAGERALASGEFVLKQRLLPTGLAELGTEAMLGKANLPSGTQLVAATADGAKVFCVADVAKQKLIGASFQPCLIDADSDGDFDGWFSTLSQTKGLLTLTGKYPKKPKPLPGIAYREIAPSAMRDEYFVAIERRNYFNIYSRESFMIAFGRDGQLDRLTSPISFKSSEMPRELTVLGARFTAVSEQEGKMLIHVSETMPQQPFGVIKTTTYHFY